MCVKARSDIENISGLYFLFSGLLFFSVKALSFKKYATV